MGSGPNDKPESGMRTNKKLSSMALVFVLVMSSMTVPFVSFVIDEAHSFTAAPFTTTDAEGAWDIHGNEMTILYHYDTDTAIVAGIEGGAAGLKILNLPEEIEHKGKKYTVTGVGMMAVSDCVTLTTVNMPSVLTILEGAFYGCTSLTTINMPKVTSIEGYAFENCTSLTTIDMPKVTTIEEYAFYCCTSLTSVNMPNVTSIGEAVFSGCTKLTEFKAFDENNGTYETINGVIHSKDGKILVAFPSGKGGKYTTGDDVTTILECAFERNEKITEIVMTNVTTVGDYAFYNCTSLTKVDMPIVTTVGEDAFSNCTSLTKVDMPEAETIENGVFGDCNSLTIINMPKVTKIGYYAFLGCTKLTEFKAFDENNDTFKTIDGVIHSKDGTKLVLFPAGRSDGYTVGESVEVIATDAFNGCIFLESVDLLNVTAIKSYAFEDCISLTSVNMPKVTSIGECAFDGCISLTTIDMPMVTTIGSNAFDGCISLTTIDMPMVMAIGSAAFENCISLTTVNMPKVTSIGTDAFENCRSLTEFQEFSRNNTVYKTIDGVIHSKDGTTLVLFPTGRAGEYIVDENVEIIADNAFNECSIETISMPNVTTIGVWVFFECRSLTTVNIPNVILIGNYAFNGCTSLTTVNMPKALSIGGHAFNGCTSLMSIDMPKTISVEGFAFNGCTSLTTIDMPKVMIVGWYAFNFCSSLTTVNIPNVTTISKGTFYSCTSLTTVNIPNVTEIVEEAFYNCTSLVTIDMPQVTSIGAFAFSNCTSLTTVNMPNVMKIGEYVFYNCTSLVEFQDFDNPFYTIIDGVIHNKNGKQVLLFPPGRGGEYTVGEDVEQIMSGAFSSCMSLMTLNIPSTTFVEEDTFDHTNIKTLVIYTCNLDAAGDVLGSIMGVWGGYLPGASDTLETVIVDCDALSSDFNGSTHEDGIVLAFTKNAKISETNIATYFENAFTMDDLQGNAYLWNEEDGIWKQCSTDDEYEVFLKYDEKMGDVDRPVYLDQLLGLQELTFRALPNEGYEFVRWSNGSTDERLDIWVYDTTTVEAIFASATGSKIVDAPLTYDDIRNDLESVYSTFTYVVDIDDLDCLVRLTPAALSEFTEGKTLIISVTENGKEKYHWVFNGSISNIEYRSPGAGLDLLVTDDVSAEIKDKAEEMNDKDMDILYINTQQNELTMTGATLSYNIGKSGTYSLYVYNERFGEFMDTEETVKADGGYVTITLNDNKIYVLMTEAQEGGGDDDLLLYGAIAAVAIVALLGIILAWRRFA